MNSAPNLTTKPLKSVMIVCYICGRQYGSKSFSIHIKSCEIKFHNEQEQKLNKFQRIKLPQAPKFFQIIVSGEYDPQTLSSYNTQAYEIFKYKILPKCAYCERTFNYESLKVHQKGCDKRMKKESLYRDKSMGCLYVEEKENVKPKTLLCCVCGRQFGTKSLKIHYPQCLEKFNNDEILRCANPKDRRKAPQFTQEQLKVINTKQQWTHEEIQEFYKNSMAKFRNQSMVECYNCKRKFNPDSIQKHMKNCILINGNLNPDVHLKKVQSEKVLHFYQKNIKKPKTLTCYICGRQFGLTSLTIHQKQCLQKFKIQQKNKPKNQRKKIPQLPQQIIQGDYNISQAQKWDQQKLQKYNTLISDTYNKKSLYQCYICNRTFFEDALNKHIIHCENNIQKLKLKRNRSVDENVLLKRCQSIKKIRQIQKSVEKQIVKPRVLMCHICGRQFGLSSLQIHLKVCPQKFKNQQLQKSKQQRKQIPQLPSQLRGEQYDLGNASQWTNQKIEHYNKLVSDVYNKKSLQTCYCCLRTFNHDSYLKHFPYCEKNTIDKLKKSPSLNEREKSILAKHKSIKKQKQMKQAQYYANLQKTKPKTLVCYICGRQYGLTSLQIHLPKCAQRFITLQNQKNKNLRKSLPILQNYLNVQQYDISKAESWSRQKINEYNEICSKIYKNKSLTKCKYCDRKFFDQQIKKHEDYCCKEIIRNLQKNKQELNENQRNLLKKCKSAKQSQFFGSYPKLNQNIRQPRVLTCHVCGRQFGSTSLKIHLPKCKQKFIKQQQKKPIQQQKKLPELCLNNQLFTFDLSKVQQWSSQQIRRYNELATQVYRKQSLQICKYCNRSFFEEQLPKHVKFCEKEYQRKMLKKSASQKQTLANSQDTINSLSQQKGMLNNSPKTQSPTSIQNKTFMSIITEEDMEHSTISPDGKKKIEQKISSSKTKTTQFNIMPIQIKDFIEQTLTKKQLTESKLTQKTEKPIKQLFNQQSNPYFLNPTKPMPRLNKKGILNNNRSMTNLYKLKKSFNESSLTLTMAQVKTDQIVESQKQIVVKIQQKIQCEHCKRKVKSQLYEKHIKTCRSNSSMTGYLNVKKEGQKGKV